MINKVRNFIKENKLIGEKDKVLVALSGGPDSICLLHILYTLKEEFGFSIGAAHVNHLLRGEDSECDERYVMRICEDLGIKLDIERIDIDRISKERGISHEMAGREERYAFFDRVKKSKGYTKVAVAHNANDQVETVMMRMMRGTGLEGLCGIRVKRDGYVIRPILCLKRNEIEEYCNLSSLKPRLDKSNLEKVYARNRVRLDIIPYMKEHFNEDIIESVNRMVNILQKDNEFIEGYVTNIFEEYCNFDKDSMVIKNELFSLNEAIVTRCIKRALIVYSEKHINFEMKHIYDLIELVELGTNRKLYLPNGIIAENIYGNIYLKKREQDKLNVYEEIAFDKQLIGRDIVEFGKYKVSFDIINNKNNIEFSNNDLIKYFDYDNIKGKLCIRNRKDGDKIRPLGMKGSKKVKDIFINMKVPVEERAKVPIVCFDSNIAWIVGYKVSEENKITRQTKKVIKITFARKE